MAQMNKRQILETLKADSTLLDMLTEEIGETAVKEPPDDEGGRDWHEIGIACVDEMLTWPLDDAK
jgi:hypothetical protein